MLLIQYLNNVQGDWPLQAHEVFFHRFILLAKWLRIWFWGEDTDYMNTVFNNANYVLAIHAVVLLFFFYNEFLAGLLFWVKGRQELLQLLLISFFGKSRIKWDDTNRLQRDFKCPYHPFPHPSFRQVAHICSPADFTEKNNLPLCQRCCKLV